MTEQDQPTMLTFFEKTLIAAGLLFFANVIYMSAGGGYLFNYIAKAVYLLGIVVLLAELYSKKS